MATNPRKSLFRKVEKTIEAIERSPDVASTIAHAAVAIVENFREDMGVRGGRLYERRDGGYEVTRTFGAVSEAAIGTFVPEEYPPIQRLIDVSSYIPELPSNPKESTDGPGCASAGTLMYISKVALP